MASNFGAAGYATAGATATGTHSTGGGGGRGPGLSFGGGAPASNSARTTACTVHGNNTAAATTSSTCTLRKSLRELGVGAAGLGVSTSASAQRHPPSAPHPLHHALAAAAAGTDGMDIGMEVEPKTPFGVQSGLLSSSSGAGGMTLGERNAAHADVHQVGTPGPGGGSRRALFRSHSAAASSFLGRSGGHSPAAAAADLSTYLSAHHAANVTRILDATRLGAERSANSIIRARLEQDWLVERIRIVGSAAAGTFAVGGEGNAGELLVMSK